jgi:hypothetical protein
MFHFPEVWIFFPAIYYKIERNSLEALCFRVKVQDKVKLELLN